MLRHFTDPTGFFIRIGLVVTKKVLKLIEQAHTPRPLQSVTRPIPLLGPSGLVNHPHLPLINIGDHLRRELKHVRVDLVQLAALFPVLLHKSIEQLLQFAVLVAVSTLRLRIALRQWKAGIGQ